MVEAKYPRGTPEHLYINLFEEVPSRDDMGSIRAMDFAGHLKEKDFPLKADPGKVISPKIKLLIRNVKSESTKYGKLDNMIIRFGSPKKHFGFIVCMFNFKTHKLYGDIYTEIKDTDLTPHLGPICGFRKTGIYFFNRKSDFLPWFLIQANLAISVQLMWSVWNVPIKTPYFVPFIFACVSSVFALSFALCLALPCASRSPAVRLLPFSRSRSRCRCLYRLLFPLLNTPLLLGALCCGALRCCLISRSLPLPPCRLTFRSAVFSGRGGRLGRIIPPVPPRIRTPRTRHLAAATAGAFHGVLRAELWVRFLIREQRAKASAKISVNGEQKFCFPQKKRLADSRILEGFSLVIAMFCPRFISVSRKKQKVRANFQYIKSPDLQKVFPKWGVTIDLNKQIDNTIDNQKDDADIPLFRGAKKLSTWVSGFLTKAGVKDGSKTNNTGSINLLRHS